jgi:peptidoglycan hydrolase-like protein with peptidoglycan-binding domain
MHGCAERAGTQPVTTVDGPRGLHRRRKIRWLVGVVVVLVVIGVAAVVLVTRVGRRDQAAAAGPEPAKTETVQKTDLAEQRNLDGKLGYGTERTLTGRKNGTITGLPKQNTVLERGKVAYSVDEKAVPLFYSTFPLYRDLAIGMTEGQDVKVVEENLKALGFTGFGAPDKKFTEQTANAIKSWQKALQLDETGTIAVGDVVTTEGPIRISTVSAELGAQGTSAVLKYTGNDRAVTLPLKTAQKDLAKVGDKVEVNVNGKPVTGTVQAVAPIAQDASSQQPQGFPGYGGPGGEQPKFNATITMDDPATAGEDATAVSVRLTTASRKAVLTVPVGALLALAEGGYAVEVIDGNTRHLVAVKLGLFANGKVEVSGPELREGMTVVTTS